MRKRKKGEKTCVLTSFWDEWLNMAINGTQERYYFGINNWWATAYQHFVEDNNQLPIYFKTISSDGDIDSNVRYKAIIRELVLVEDDGEREEFWNTHKDESWLKDDEEWTYPTTQTFVGVSDVQCLSQVHSQTELILFSERRPIDENYTRSYCICYLPLW